MRPVKKLSFLHIAMKIIFLEKKMIISHFPCCPIYFLEVTIVKMHPKSCSTRKRIHLGTTDITNTYWTFVKFILIEVLIYLHSSVYWHISLELYCTQFIRNGNRSIWKNKQFGHHYSLNNFLEKLESFHGVLEKHPYFKSKTMYPLVTWLQLFQKNCP